MARRVLTEQVLDDRYHDDQPAYNIDDLSDDDYGDKEEVEGGEG